MEKTKAEVEKTVSKILKFIQTKNKIPKEAKKELLGLVNDLQEQCQSLYSILDDLQEGSDSEIRGRKGKLHAASSSSSSDWEYYSSEETESNAGNVSENVAGNFSSKEENGSSELKRKLVSLNSEFPTVFSKLQETELANKNLSSKTGEKEQELTVHVKELEHQLSDTKAELKAQRDQNGVLEKQIVMRVSEAKKLGERNKGLHFRIAGLELVLKEKGDEISNLVNKFGKSEVRLTSRIEDVRGRVSNLQRETDFLRARNVRLAGSIEGKRSEEMEYLRVSVDQVNFLKHELASIREKKKDLESEMEKKIEEVSETRMRLRHLEEEKEERIKADMKILEEKEDLLTKVKKLEVEVNDLQKERYNFEDRLKSNIIEIDELREENQKLHARIEVLDSSQTEKEKKNIDEREDWSMKLDMKLSDQQKLVKEQEDIIRRLSAKLKDQQKLLKDQKDTIDKFSEDQKLVKRLSFGSIQDGKLNHSVLERKMEELAEDFRMKMEDHIRLLYRRIHVAEQIHQESKNSYIKARENRGNGESQGNSALCETQIKKIEDMLERALSGSKAAIKKLEEAGEYTVRVTRIAGEIDAARRWVQEKNGEVEDMKHESETLAAKLECREAQEALVKEKLSKLEGKLAEQGTEKMSLEKGLSRLERRIRELEMDVKEREIELESLGEEKRDAIRQLCLLLDYHRVRYDDLKKSFFKVALKT